MKKNFLALGTCAFALGLVACDDSTSANGSSGDEIPAEESSSSVILSDSEGSSSSVTSSSSVESSSSVVSSSSSSSAPTEDPSDSKLAWQYLNPSIDYGTMTDARDGQVYKTVKICDDKDENCQTWLAENLNYAYTGVKYNYYGHTSDSTSWCYDDDPSNCATYGRLYTWAAAVDSVAIYKNYGEECGYGKFCTRFSASALATAPVRGVCPSGWHLPSTAEWGALYTNVGGDSYAGQLKANTSLWTSYSRVTNDDSFGFSVPPAGFRNNGGDFDFRGYFAYFWSSTEREYDGFTAWYHHFYYDGDYACQRLYNKYYAFSVRCLKDSF